MLGILTLRITTINFASLGEIVGGLFRHGVNMMAEAQYEKRF